MNQPIAMKLAQNITTINKFNRDRLRRSVTGRAQAAPIAIANVGTKRRAACRTIARIAVATDRVE